MMKARNSQIEMLRIMCMLYIVLGHYVGNGLTRGIAPPYAAVSILSFCIVGVNCFVMISGYYLIKKPIKSVIRIFLQASFYSLLLFVIFSSSYNCFDVKHFIKALFCVSHGGLWFVGCYIQLCLISPILNIALKSATVRQLWSWVLFLTIINVYFGFTFHGSVNPNGFNLMHFIYMYVIGYTLRKSNIRISGKNAIAGYIALSIIIAICALFMANYNTGLYTKYAFNYNNPFIVISSALLFIAFSKYNFVNEKLNFLSKGIFAVYLIQGNPYVKKWIYEFIGTLPDSYSELILYALIIVLAVITVLSFSLIDAGRRFLFSLVNVDKLLDRIKYE